VANMQNSQKKFSASPFSGYQAGQQTFGPQQTVQTSMGNFPNLQAYQQQQDAFVQQHLKNQAQYNQGLQSGQSPQRVPVMDAWKQAGENVQSGQYQGNPFQTGNVDAIMGMFNQYGIQAPQGFRDQLLQNLGQQSAPPMYQPQRNYNLGSHERSLGEFIQPGPMQPPQPWVNTQPGGPTFIPGAINPATGLPYGQQPPTVSPGGPMGSPDLTPGMQVPGSWIVQMPQTNADTAPNVPPGWGVRRLGFGMYSIEAPGQSQADVAAWASQAGASGLSPNRVHGHLRQPQPPTSMQPVAPPAMTYPGGPMPPGQMPSKDGFIDTRGSGEGNFAVMVPYYNPATGETTHRTAGIVPAPGSGWVHGTGPSAGQQPPAAAPGYGARIRNPTGGFTTQVLDRDGDGIDDRDQLGPGQPLPTVYSPLPQMGYPSGPSGNFIPKFTDPTTGLPYGQQPPMGYPGGPMQPPPAAQPNPSDPWSYPLLPGHTRGPSGEQIMTREAREAEIRRMEQESGRTYVRPKAGVTNGGWLPPAKPKPGASISLNPEQAAAMKQYMDSRQSGRAQPTPARTRGTPYRSGKK